MTEFTNQLQLYKPRKTDTKQTTLDELANNADKMEAAFNRLLLDVTNFGAKLDGITDDSTAIKNALTFSLMIGSKVYIPYTIEGCLIGSTIDLPDNAWIVGVKTKLLSKLITDANGYSCPTKIFNKVNGSNIVLESLILDGQQDKGTWVGGSGGTGVSQNNLFYFENVTGIRLLDFEITNFRNNKEASTTPDTFYPFMLKNCSFIFGNDVRITTIVNTEGIRFLFCNNIHMNDFKAINHDVWTPLHLYYCDNVVFDNPYIENTNTNWDLASSINMYSKNVKFNGGKIIGGRGIDPSDEYAQGNGFISENVTFNNVYIETLQGFYTSVASLIKNLKIIGGKVKSTNNGMTFYLTQLDGFKMKRVELETTNTAAGIKGLQFDTRSGGYVKNARIGSNKFNGYDTGIYLYLRQGEGFDDVQIDKNKIYTSALGVKDSYSGSSCGVFVYLYDADVQSGAYFKNIFIQNNNIDAEGSYILFISNSDSNAASVIDSKKLNILDNTCHSTRNAIKRGIQIRDVKKVQVRGNTITDLDTSAQNVFSYCQDIRLGSNESNVKTSGQPGWRIDNCSGYLNTVGNIGGGTITGNFLYSGSGGNSFTSKSNIGNLPNTVDAAI